MRRSNRHHASTAAADAMNLPKSPSRNRGGDGRASVRSMSSKSSTSSSVAEPRKQRAAAVAAKDAMTLIANNGLAPRDDSKASNVSKKESTRLGKRAIASATPNSASKVPRTAPLEEITTVESPEMKEANKGAKSELIENSSEPMNTVLDVSATIPRDLSHFPRELTVKEVIAKTMRVNRVSTRGLSRDIVGLMKDMRNEEKQSSQTNSSEPVLATSALDKNSLPVESSKNSLDAVIDGVLSMARKPSAITLAQSQLASAALSGENSPSKPKRQYVRVRATSNGELYVNGQLYAPNSLMSDAAPTPIFPGDKTVSSAPVSLAQSPADAAFVSSPQSIAVSSQITEFPKERCHNETKVMVIDGQCESKKDISDPHLDEEVLVDVVGDVISSSKSAPRELSVSEKVVIINDFDEGMLPHELEQKYNITKLQVAEVLRNRIPIIRQQATSFSDRHALKRRRTNFVGLNLLMWRFFCECRDQGIVLNGRQLKEHALSIARQLGLHNFKGSEGWLDSFKRRHNIDLKTMTGQPVIYEAEADLNGFCVSDNPTSTTTNLDGSLRMSAEESAPIVDANQFLIDATDAAAKSAGIQSSGISNMNGVSTSCGSSTSDSGPCQATAAVHTTQPLDLARVFPSTSTAFPLPNSFIQNPADYLLSNDCLNFNWRSSGVSLANQRLDTLSTDTVQALIETCLYRADEPEVSRAIETLRSYITMTDMSLLPLLVNLQKGLTGIVAKKKLKESPQNNSSQNSDSMNKQTSLEQKIDADPCTTPDSVGNVVDSSVSNAACRGSLGLNNVVTSTTGSKICHDPTLASILQNVVPQISVDPISNHSQC